MDDLQRAAFEAWWANQSFESPYEQVDPGVLKRVAGWAWRAGLAEGRAVLVSADLTRAVSNGAGEFAPCVKPVSERPQETKS